MDLGSNPSPNPPRSEADGLRVVRSQVVGVHRQLILSNGLALNLHRFACAGQGDTIKVCPPGSRPEIEVICKNGRVPLTPPFQLTVTLPALGTHVRLKEIETDRELRAFDALASHHYRNTVSFGRRAVLIARIGSGTDQRMIGYIELTNSFSGHQARNTLLNAAFLDASGVAWTRWDGEAKKKYLNTIARISRCVVHPEYRGLGVGVALCGAAIEFCKSRWQIAGLKPLFLEITADMLKFVPFAEQAGMHFIGLTTGNLGRLAKDQKYLQSVQSAIDAGERDRSSHSVFSPNSGSILKRQQRDVYDLKKLADQLGSDVVQVLRTYMWATRPEDVSPVAYELLHKFIRFPKPTYMVGLTPDASKFVNRRLGELGVTSRSKAPDLAVTPLKSPIGIEELTIRHRIGIPSAAWSNALQEAFGIHRDAIDDTGVRRVSVEIRPREILYVWGPSGSGKTVFLDALRGSILPSEGAVRTPKDALIGTLSLDFADVPVACAFGGSSQISEALYALGMVGLSDATIYFKHPNNLSSGQRYRLALAQLIASRSNVWVIDEFCSILDDSTARLISWNVAKFARRLGVTAVIAGPRKEPVLSSLAPDRILTLDSLSDWKLSSGS